MMFRSSSLFALVLVSAALGAACDVHVGDNGVSLDVAAGKASEEWARTYTLADGGSLEIVNTNGGIVLNAGTGRQVEVKATRQARAGSEEEAQALLKQTSITEDVSPARISLHTSNGTGIVRGRRSLTVEYQVRIPSGVQVTLKTENGGIGLHDVNGTVTASTTNGGIRGTNLSGVYSAHIVNGGIVMEVVRATGPIELESVNGGIRLDVPADLRADIEARAVNGGVSAADNLSIAVADQSRARLIGKLNGGGIKISASTVNGGVQISAITRAAATAIDQEAFDQRGAAVEQKR